MEPAVAGERIQSKHITHEKAPPITDLDGAYGVVTRMRARLQAAVKGRDDVIELVIIAVLADGHVLLEDFPGVRQDDARQSPGRQHHRRHAA